MAIKCTGIGRDDGSRPPPTWLAVTVHRAKLLHKPAGTIAAGPVSMVNQFKLGCFTQPGIGEVAQGDPDSALWEDAGGTGLKMASASNITLHPGGRPNAMQASPASRGLVLSKGDDIKDPDGSDGDKATNAQLHGKMTAIGGVDAVHAEITGGGMTITGDAVITGNVQPAPDTSAPLVGNYLVPRGAIIMWSGHYSDIPKAEGWAMCDGTNGTPDLQSRFVVGAKTPTSADNGYTNYTAHDFGGNSETLNLEIDHMPPHDHNWHVDEPDHSHGMSVINNSNHDSDGNSWDVTTPGFNKDHPLATDGGKTGNKWEKCLSSQGKSTTIEMRPPYYALCYIMKL